MVNGQYIIPGSFENDALRHAAEEVFVDSEINEIDHPTQKRVDEIIENYPVYALEQAFEVAAKRHTIDAFDQLLVEHPELYGLIYDAAEGVSIDAELYRASAKPDVLKTPLRARAFGIFLEKPELGVRLIDAESKLGGEMFGNE